MQLRVAVCGAHSGGLQALRQTVDLGYEAAVVAARDATMEQFARKREIPIIGAAEVKTESFARRLRSLGVDVLISVQLPYLICREVLESPRLGCFNLHPSLLPRYAGLHPAAWAIYRGEHEHGVTLHWMTPDTDAGPIVSQQAVPIADTDTPPTLLRNCLRAGMPLLAELLAMAASGSRIPQVPQDLSRREYFGRQAPGGGRIDWNRTAGEIANQARAFNHSPFPLPWGHLQTEVLGQMVEVMKAEDTGVSANAPPGTVGESGSEGGILMAAADNWVRIIEYVRVPE